MATDTAQSGSTQQDTQRNVRPEILAAARRVLTRDGAGSVTFANVANEAGVSPDIVSGHFQSAQELLLAIAASGLNSLARTTDDGAAKGSPQPKNEMPLLPRESIRKKPLLPAPLEQVMQQVAPGSGDKELATGALARLERRVQVMEKAVTDIADRHERSVTERANQMASIEESISSVLARMDASDRHHSDLMGEMRRTLSDAGLRLNALEERTSAFAHGSEFAPGTAAESSHEMHVPSVEAAATAQEVYEMEPFERIELKPDYETDKGGKASDPDKPGTYLSAARRAAMAAAETENTMSAALDTKQARKGSRGKFLLFACLAPVAILGTAFMVLNRNPVTAQVAPISELAPPPVPDASQDLAAAEPSETVTALPSAVPMDDLLKTAEAGDTKAERDVGLRYLAGDGIDVDESEAARWLMQAAYKGEPTAEYWLATLYARGHGVPSDAFQANHWYEASAKQGNRRAMHSLAVANYQGWGMEKNLVEAARWFKSAAELGLVDSQFNLAVLYERGAGVPQNLAEAYKWYAIAAAEGDKEAESRIAVLVNQLPKADLESAQAAAANFKPLPLDQSANLIGGPSQLPGG